MRPEDFAKSLREPQLEPSDHAITVLQDHGPRDGGWGPAAIVLPWMPGGPRPFIYTGDAPHVIETMEAICRKVAQDTGKPTKLVRYTQREDLFTVGGAS